MVSEQEREDIARAKRVQDYADSMDESAGRSNGKMRRFLPKNETPEALERRRKDERSFLDAITLRERTEALQHRLADLDRRSLIALAAAEHRARLAREQLDRIREAANRDRHGMRVYKTEDGLRAFYEDGTALTPTEMADVQWRQTAPTWEELVDAGQANDAAERDVREITRFRERLAEHEETLAGDPTPEELELIEQELADLPPALQGRFDAAPRHSAARDHVPDHAFAGAPDVCGAFACAATATDAPELSTQGRAPPAPVRQLGGP